MACFTRSIEDLKLIIDRLKLRGEWQHSVDKHVFRVNGKQQGIINWWPSTGMLNFQGPVDIARELEGKFNEIVSDDGTNLLPSVTATKEVSRQIFVVHGHDVEAREQLELVLRRLSLEPYILMNTSGGGKTIIEALEGKIGRDYSADFGIVLMTPDDKGYSETDGVDRTEPRARQNVVLEAGMLLSSLTRDRTAFIVKGHVELPSDLQGIIRINYNNHVKEIGAKLAQRLQEAGFELTAEQISKVSA